MVCSGFARGLWVGRSSALDRGPPICHLGNFDALHIFLPALPDGHKFCRVRPCARSVDHGWCWGDHLFGPRDMETGDTLMRIACVGEAMIELSLTEPPRIGVAGDTLNTAIYLKRTSPSLQVDYVTRLGRDPFSQQIRDFVASHGIGTHRSNSPRTVFPDCMR
jgi:hypothetical protein